MKIPIFSQDGKDTGKKVELVDNIFNIKPNDHAIYLDVKTILQNKRQGTSKSKTRKDVSGSTRKLRKQKGSGGARIGSSKSPLLHSGGTIFGPEPRTYDTKLNVKVKKLARFSALSYKAKDNFIVALENIEFSSPKTKECINFLNNFKLNNEKVILILSTQDKNIYLSGRNLKKFKCVAYSDLNTVDIVNYNKLIFTVDALNEFQKKYSTK